MARGFLVLHTPTGRYLRGDGTWTREVAEAVPVADAGPALSWLDRFACELGAFDVVDQPDDVAA